MNSTIPISMEAYQISVIHDYLIEMFIKQKIDEATFRLLISKIHEFVFEGGVE